MELDPITADSTLSMPTSILLIPLKFRKIYNMTTLYFFFVSSAIIVFLIVRGKTPQNDKLYLNFYFLVPKRRGNGKKAEL